jgi:DNA-binding NarL/FixJ family response regulator
MKKTIKEKVMNGMYQKEMLYKLAEGYTYKEIAKELKLSKWEMSVCIKVLYEKYHAHNKPFLVCKALLVGDIVINRNK